MHSTWLHHNQTHVQTYKSQYADCIFIPLHWISHLGLGTVVLHRCVCLCGYRLKLIAKVETTPTVFYSSLILQSRSNFIWPDPLHLRTFPARQKKCKISMSTNDNRSSSKQKLASTEPLFQAEVHNVVSCAVGVWMSQSRHEEAYRHNSRHSH